MKNLSAFLLVVAIGSGVCSAGEPVDVQNFEGEASVALSMPLGSYREGHSEAGAGLGVALRYNVPSTALDAGVFVRLDCAQRSFPESGFSGNQNNRALCIGVSGAWNFRQGQKVNPFAEMGIAVALNDVVGSRAYPVKSTAAAFVPKIGCEFFHHIRVNAYCQFSRKGFNTYGLSVGLVIGGRPNK